MLVSADQLPVGFSEALQRRAEAKQRQSLSRDELVDRASSADHRYHGSRRSHTATTDEVVVCYLCVI